MLLCLDTSDGVGVALIDRGGVLGREGNTNSRQHAESLAPMITEVLAQAGAGVNDLTTIVVGTGPAPFTGLRVGIVTGRTMAQALGIAAVGVPSLAGIARQACDDVAGLGSASSPAVVPQYLVGESPHVLVVTDARRREVYWARYQAKGADDVAELSAPAVNRPAEVMTAEFADDVLVGRGVELYPESFAAGHMLTLDPASLGRIASARLASGISPAALPTAPLYLRRPDIHQGEGRKRAS